VAVVKVKRDYSVNFKKKPKGSSKCSNTGKLCNGFGHIIIITKILDCKYLQINIEAYVESWHQVVKSVFVYICVCIL
jgi:hypothetical protein